MPTLCSKNPTIQDIPAELAPSGKSKWSTSLIPSGVQQWSRAVGTSKCWYLRLTTYQVAFFWLVTAARSKYGFLQDSSSLYVYLLPTAPKMQTLLCSRLLQIPCSHCGRYGTLSPPPVGTKLCLTIHGALRKRLA